MMVWLALFVAAYVGVGLWLAPGTARKFGVRVAEAQGKPLRLRQKALIFVLATLIQPVAFVAVLLGQLRK